MSKLHVSLVAVVLLMGGCLTASTLFASELTATYATPPPPVVTVLPQRDLMRVDLDILVDGKPVRLISHEGRLYLPVPRMGAEYEIRVHNHGPRRIAAIVSVDGLSVISGRPASERQPGYLVDAYSHLVIRGWRRDQDTVAAFTFETRENSYAARMGHPENTGVIGLLTIEEWDARPHFLDRLREKMPSAAKGEALGDTGTGWGRDIGSSVIEVPFVRSQNKRTVTIYYDTEDALRRRGVPVDHRYPDPFPADPRYAPPPPMKPER